MSHLYYRPAYLESGANATTDVTNWAAITDGSFRITIDGTQRDITGLDFSTVSSMLDVAYIIQSGIRAATSGTETCTWNGTKFIISSVNTTTSSAITVTSAVGSGTDLNNAFLTLNSFSTGTGASGIVIGFNSRKYGQVFTPSINYSLSRVSCSFKVATGSPTGTLTCYIYTVGGNNTPCGGALVGTGGTLDISTITGTYASYDFDFITPVDLTGGTRYGIVFIATGGNISEGINEIQVRGDSHATETQYIEYAFFQNGPVSCSTSMALDLWYSTYGNINFLDMDTGTVYGARLETAGYDDNRIKVCTAVDSTDDTLIQPLEIDQATGGLLMEAG